MDKQEPRADTWAAAWGDWLKKSTQTNIRFVKEVTTAYSELLKKDRQKERAPDEWGKIVSHLAEPYFTFYREHAENWMDWSKKLSTEIEEQAEKIEDAVVESSAPETPTSRAVPPNSAGIKLSGKPGDTVTTTFRLNSGNPLAQKGIFVTAYFFKTSDHTVTRLRPKFEPDAFDLSSGEPVLVHVAVKIFKNAQPGWYKSRVEVEGVANAGFDILLEITS